MNLLYLVGELNAHEYEIHEVIVYRRPRTIEDKIRRAFPEIPDLMVEIARCESGLRQFDDNGNYIASHTSDSGLLQINDFYWAEKAEELGLNYKWNVEDNIAMARHIFDVAGVESWVCYRIVRPQLATTQ